jgi:hypothetical protein
MRGLIKIVKENKNRNWRKEKEHVEGRRRRLIK